MRANASPTRAAPDDAERAVIELRHVTKTFRSRQREVVALDDIDLQIAGQGITGLVGPDAAGKTSLMRLIVALLFPDEGDVRVFGLDTRRNAQSIQSSVSYMPQQFGLYEDLSVCENLSLYADLHGITGSGRTERSEQLLHMAGLNEFQSRRAGRLSGGMKQKLGLACALIGRPRLLLLDEPTAGVDPLSRRELWQIINQLVQDEHMAVLISTAYLDEAQRCDEVVMLHEGHILSIGRPQDSLDELKNRVFLVRAPGLSRRTLRQRLRREAAVMDATVESGGVRVLTRTEGRPSFDHLAADSSRLQVEAVSPRFEDSFVAVLQSARAPSEHREADRTGPYPGATAASSGRPDDNVVIAVRDVSRRFGRFYAVKDVSFEVRRGEVFGLLGANGAGKSTTFRMLCGLLPATSGSLLVAGVELRQAAARARRRIGYMAQKFSLYGKLSVRENLVFFSSAYGLAGPEQRERVSWALERFELRNYTQVAGLELPLGYRQRLSMACALMHEPEIVFLDEPTSGVDPLARREFWDHILELAARGVTIMVTTHFMNEAEYCDRVAIMNAGQILTIDTPEGIRRGASRGRTSAPTMEDAFVQLIEEARSSHE